MTHEEPETPFGWEQLGGQLKILAAKVAVTSFIATWQAEYFKSLQAAGFTEAQAEHILEITGGQFIGASMATIPILMDMVIEKQDDIKRMFGNADG